MLSCLVLLLLLLGGLGRAAVPAWLPYPEPIQATGGLDHVFSVRYKLDDTHVTMYVADKSRPSPWDARTRVAWLNLGLALPPVLRQAQDIHDTFKATVVVTTVQRGMSWLQDEVQRQFLADLVVRFTLTPTGTLAFEPLERAYEGDLLPGEEVTRLEYQLGTLTFAWARYGACTRGKEGGGGRTCGMVLQRNTCIMVRRRVRARFCRPVSTRRSAPTRSVLTFGSSSKQSTRCGMGYTHVSALPVNQKSSSPRS